MVMWLKRFLHQANKQDFLRDIKSFSKIAQNEPSNVQVRRKFQNMVNYYKDVYLQFNSDPEVLCTLSYWANKIGSHDAKLWELIDKEIPNALEVIRGKSLVLLAHGVIGRPEAEKVFLNHVIARIDELSPRELAEIVKTLPNSELLNILASDYTKILIGNGLDLLFYVTAFNDPGVLDYLETKFYEMLPNLNNMQTILGIVYELSNKERVIKYETVYLLEQKIINSAKDLNLKDINHTLQLFQKKYFWGIVSKEFWDNFEEIVKNSSEKFPIAIVMSYCSKNLFFRPALFEYLKNKWIEQVELNKEVEVFREGFRALANTPYFTGGLMEWSKHHILKMMNKFNGYDTVTMMKALTLISNYDPEIWNPFIERFSRYIYKKINDKERLIAHNISVCLDIDKPDGYLEWKEKIIGNIGDSYKSVPDNRIKGKYERIILDFLKDKGFEAVTNCRVNELYEVDLIMPEKKIIVEFLGKPWHISQHNMQIDPQTQQKFRHLNILGWNVIGISEMDNFEISLINALNSLENQQNNPQFIHIDK
ncbi:unnamed protein product [Blepharisma stoltei]|uniref:DUF559 domain-containing protein n=1 Tax=Blepharisma stoltei TaxID=1481888 RepID=A0AAU9KEK6_9CILI|nr:unnamed protein product [Blepharisma stoltei]